jgi:simple sugar transport system ATP-binding protein
MLRGEMMKTLATADTSPAELAELMVGRRVLLRVEKGPPNPGAMVLEVENLSLTDAKGVARLKSVSFVVRAGEILGIAGVAGNGQSELLEVLAGIRPATAGKVRLAGKPLDLSRSTNADDRRDARVAHVPEDRHRRGLVMPFAEWENSCLGYQREERFEGAAFTLDRTAIRDLARESIERFDIRPPSCDLKTSNFSGGNQQKIVIAREMERDPEVLLVGQPTRGVDIGAIEFIHQQIVALRDRGKAILLVSVELDEIQALADRIIVMFDGRISGERIVGETDERELGLLMAGIDPTTRGAA